MSICLTQLSLGVSVQVRAILLDPSCSGSGMDSLERRVEQQQGGGGGKKERQRLLSLSQFQYKALTKAFSFPQVPCT